MVRSIHTGGTLRPLLAAAIGGVLLFVPDAFATVKSVPVRVRLAGPPRAAEPGNPYEGVLLIAARAEADVEELFINTGQTWKIVGDPLPTRVHLAAGETRSLPFSVVSDDPSEPFVIEYQLNGDTVRKPVDVSPEATAARHPRALERVDDPAMTAALQAMADDAALRPEPSPASDRRDRREPNLEQLAAEPPRATADYNLRVVGYFHYRRMNDGAPVGVDGAVARVYDEDSSWDELLATQVLGPDGRLDVTFNWDPCFGCDGTPDIYVEFELDNAEIAVQEGGVLEVDYTWETGVWNDFGGTYLDIGNQTPNNAAEIPACHVMVNAMRAWRFAANSGRDTPKLDIQWPETDPCGACYNAFWEEIYLDNARVWNENTITHEFGHHFVNSFATYIEPNYCVSGFCDNNPPDDCGHCEWCRETTEDAFSEGFPSYFGNAVMRTYTQPTVTPMRAYESVARCGTDNQAHDPWQTEGWFASMLLDIDDAAQDDDPTTIGAKDELNLGFDEIFWLVDTFGPTTPAAFISRFNENYPAFKEQMWATASNNGYQYDVAPPGKVTNITSDHTLNSDQDTRTVIKWFWNRAPDDASGIAGYSIWVQRNILPGMPDAIEEVGDVTQYVSGPHTPGWYWISIRAKDRNGTWSDTYETHGPFGIRAADPANLKVKIHSNWDYLGVTARHVPDATDFETHAPSYLDGTGGATYLSAIYNNSGEAPTNSPTGQFWSDIFLDGYPVAFQHQITPLNPFEYVYILNKPVVIGPGRHVLRVQCDETGLLSEPDELDNYWARQWAWVPPLSYAGATGFHTSPPGMWTDTQWIIDGSAYYPNSRGFRIVDSSNNQPNNMWLATSLHANDGADYDLAVHGSDNSPTAAFTAPSWGSYRGAFATDIILQNGWQLFFHPWLFDFGVLNYSGGLPGVNGFHLQTVTSTSIGYPGSYGESLNTDEMVRIYQFDTPGGELFARVQLQDPSLGRVYLSVVHGSQISFVGALHTLGTLAVTDPTTGEATITGNYAAEHMCLAVWRDPNMGNSSVAYTVTVQPTPSDPMVATPPGWAAPLVPRPANDGAPGAVPAPAFLVGDAAQTWFNYALSNNSPVAVPPNPVLTASLYVDGVLRVSDSPPAPGANATVTRNLATAQSIPGGRHTFGLHIDSADQVGEMTNANNTTAGQWVWQPATKPFEATQPVLPPPDRFAGWNLMPPGTPLWFNMNGLRSPTTGPDVSGNGWKVAFLSLPDAGSDFDLQLFEAATTATAGFDNALVSSAWGIDQVDFVLADYRVTTPRAFDVGFVAPTVQPGTGLVQLKRSKSLGVGPAAPGVAGLATRAGSSGADLAPRSTQAAGTHGPFTIVAGDLFELFEVDLPPGNYDVRVVPGTGTIDWGISLHAPGAAFQARSDALPGGTAWEAPAGQAELLEVTIPEAGQYSVLVWKNQVAQVYTSGSFSLQFIRQTTGVPAEPAPMVSRLISGVRPNPFVKGTRVEMLLPAAAPVSLAVFDLVGRRVMEQDLGTLDPGTHEVEWNGQDDQGRPASAGIYFVRVTAGALRDERKVVRVP